MSLQTTSSQTVGPYLHIGLTWLVNSNLAGPGVAGDKVTIEGRITDGDGNPVNDALVEIWQANAAGRYAHPDDTRDLPLEDAFKGFGRLPTDEEGRFRFTTIKPGRVPGEGGVLQAPHINVTIFMRGMLKHLCSRIYFPDDAANGSDPALARVPAARRPTLIAQRSASDPAALMWNVRLQGDGETVFFDA
ncbi:MAG: protocatechuate 3,4-dioxygenase subunit alpha [Betaproteobacteria bacterium]